ncbi:hypothetical protein JW935_19605 [candidate division KSB1 bacterium]|nr:hypothetical protein [candidate division KSB1 bacterium]
MRALKKWSFLFLFLLFACSAQTNLVPLGKGNMSMNGSFGGPIVSAFNTWVPIPYMTTGMGFGVNDRLDVDANLHLLSLPYSLLGFHTGASWYPVISNGSVPTIGVHPQLLGMVSMKKNVSECFKVYPVVSGSVAWPVKRGLFFLGMDLCVPFTRSDYDKNPESAILSPYLGYRWKIASSWYLYTELKWHGANVQSDQFAVDYLNLYNYGALTPLFAIQRSF